MSSLSTFRSQAAEAMVKYREIYEIRKQEDGTVAELTNEQFIEIFGLLAGHEISTAIFYSPRHTFYGWTSPLMVNPSEDPRATLEYIKNNRMKTILWMATMYSLGAKTSHIYSVNVRNANIIMGQDEQRQGVDGVGVETLNFYQFLMHIRDLVVTKDDLLMATIRYSDWLKSYNAQVSRIVDHNNGEEKNNGLAKVFQDAPKPDEEVIKTQLAEAIKLLPVNGLTSRTWGFEVEVPDAKGVDVASNLIASAS